MHKADLLRYISQNRLKNRKLDAIDVEKLQQRQLVPGYRLRISH